MESRQTNFLLVISLTGAGHHSQLMESLDDPLLKEIMTRFKENSRSVTKDILNGIGMFELASRLILYLAVLIAAYTFVFLSIGYYQVGQLYGQIGMVVSASAVGFLICTSLWFRRKYVGLKKTYAPLFDLF